VQLYGNITSKYRRSEETKGRKSKVRTDGSHECGWKGSGDYGIRVVIEETGVSKSIRYGT